MPQETELEIEHDWTKTEYPGSFYYSDSGTLKKLEFTEKLWYKAQTVLDKNSERSDIINFLKLSDKSTVNEVNN